MIHEQVQMQLDYLKLWVDDEEKNRKQCEEWNIPYVPSNRKWKNERQYRMYAKEIEENGDKNLLVMVRLKGDGGINMYGIYPFARRYADDWELLVHRTEAGAEILFRRDEVEIVKQ